MAATNWLVRRMLRAFSLKSASNRAVPKAFGPAAAGATAAEMSPSSATAVWEEPRMVARSVGSSAASTGGTKGMADAGPVGESTTRAL